MITNAAHLDNIRDHLSSHFQLGQDIQLDSNTNWNPIGSVSSPFTGNLDGKGHVIRGLRVDGGGNIGLFASIADGANIRELALEDASVASTQKNVGLLVGHMQGGTIDSSSVMGDVTADSFNAGLLVGFMEEGTISNSSSSGTVVNEDYYTGGLVGRMSAEAKLTRTFADATVKGFGFTGGLVGASEGTIEESFAIGSAENNASSLGGLVGENYGTISQSYSWVDVGSGSNDVGGLVGSNADTVTETYASGSVNSASPNIGGLIGANTGTVSRSYYDADTSGQSDTDKGTPLTTAEMKQEASFSGWEFASVWEIQEGSGYPTLQWE
ncbi:hypothetical protein LOK74_18980 [Brevibacillus humidisoli]|uniref:hypothetical protein n=1 Tax=Brevibacillus humidisoli TaxID=2895522 RepID=UPI001E2C3868|nr:hypothetical protein [Brevibacillus humidisoli]UFJ40098.1 hypothetical protein LOK74_18980 [Brevibacillus humidisoli]